MTKNKLKLLKFESKDELFSEAAKNVQIKLENSIQRNDNASFIVPGGTTPAPAFKLLSESDLQWQKITVAQSDERWLDTSHEQSNERLTRENLLINGAKNANYVSMKNEADSIENGEAFSDEAYKAIAKPFTICMLGMGLDGHIASLFPNSNNIENALSLTNENNCIAIDATGCPVAGDYPKRMSLTLTAILNSETIMLLMTGEEKLDVLEQALDKEPEASSPISFILNQHSTPVEIYWCK